MAKNQIMNIKRNWKDKPYQKGQKIKRAKRMSFHQFRINKMDLSRKNMKGIDQTEMHIKTNKRNEYTKIKTKDKK